MVDLSPQAQAMKQKLLGRYIDSLPAKQAELAEAWQSARSQNTASQGLSQLKSLAHRLAGSAGSYGLGELSEAALALDRVLADCGGSPPRLADIEGYVTGLMTALDNFS
jgi:HPt (histidine-containing phosphotransfer) domain-containing protein